MMDEYVASQTVATQAVTSQEEDAPAGASGPKIEPGLDRVIDVPLTVMLRFGERRMRLQEVLALTAGSLVGLDRQVEEPVELLLGDRLLARGEVLIVDGNYGLRVTEVVDAPRLAHF